jgi:hypothetical protein
MVLLSRSVEVPAVRSRFPVRREFNRPGHRARLVGQNRCHPRRIRTSMPRRLRHALLASLLVAALAACGDDDDTSSAQTTTDGAPTQDAVDPDESADADGDDPASADPDPDGDDPAGDDTGPDATGEDADGSDDVEGETEADPEPVDAVATQEEMQAALLTVGDMAEGWTESSDPTDAEFPCDIEAELSGRSERAVAQFELEEEAALLQAVLAAPAGAGDALFDDLGDLLAECREEDADFTIEFSEEDAPDVGDRARRFVGELTGPDGSTGRLPWIIVQRGDLVLNLASVDLGGGDDEIADRYVEPALERLDEAELG